MKEISLQDYLYELPEDRIAKHPLPERSMSKLLFFNGDIEHSQFRDLDKFLPSNSTLVFNNTRVIPARMEFRKDSGARIEIFLTEPLRPSREYQVVMNSGSPVVWQCMVGNKKKWKDDQVLKSLSLGLALTASWVDRENGWVKFNWTGTENFQQVLESAAEIPLPPYMQRRATEEDRERYQTVYSRHEGAVAAPTAGLHFDENIMDRIREKHDLLELTLHVSAGTFQPIKEQNVADHSMHREFFRVERSVISSLASQQAVIAVGTTSLRTLESLYWFGVMLEEDARDVFIPKLYPYENGLPDISRERSMKNILAYMNRHGLHQLDGETEIFIFPGYRFRMIEGLITNFHLPGSTLLLLIAALIGDKWKEVYEEAMNNDYRFLSYGDSSLLLRNYRFGKD